MTAILVVLTIVVFLSVDVWRTRVRRRVAAQSARAMAPLFDVNGFALPSGLFLGPGHTWARLEPDGSVVIGIDELANQLLGPADRVQLAAKGTELSHGDAALVAHRREKNLAFAAPVQGSVTEVNLEALQHPARVYESPYENGWLLRLQPRNLAKELARLRIGRDAHDWLHYEVKRVGDFVTRYAPDMAVGASMADGGVPVAHVLEHLDAENWARFEQEFLLNA